MPGFLAGSESQKVDGRLINLAFGVDQTRVGVYVLDPADEHLMGAGHNCARNGALGRNRAVEQYRRLDLHALAEPQAELGELVFVAAAVGTDQPAVFSILAPAGCQKRRLGVEGGSEGCWFFLET